MSLTVVIASYNRNKALMKAVRSALQQDEVKSVIVVDDASETLPDLSGLGSSRLRLIAHSQNKGICAVRNTGLSLVETEFVSYLDDDDYLPRNAYAPLLETLADHKAVVVGTVLVEREGKLIGRRCPPSSQAGQIWGLDRELLRERWSSFACRQSAIFPTALLRDIGGWNEALRSRSQTELFFRICMRHPVMGIDHPAYILTRGARDHLTDDLQLRLKSYNYIIETYADLLADPDRRAYFEQNHASNVRRSNAWFRALDYCTGPLQRIRARLLP